MAIVEPETLDMRRSDMFSPIVATLSVMISATVLPPMGAAFSASTSSTVSATFAISATISWNSALRATKSVSEFTSTSTPVPPSVATATRPSAAVRPAFLSALARPLTRKRSTAASISPSVSVRAFFASIMPAPVLSRSSFTRAAVIAIVHSPFIRTHRKVGPLGVRSTSVV